MFGDLFNTSAIRADYDKKIETLRNMAASTNRALSTLAELGISHGKKRDLNKSFGWYNEEDLVYALFNSWFQRHGFANILISKVPKSAWRDGSYLYPEADRDKKQKDRKILLPVEMTAIRRAGIYAVMEKAHIQARIGHYSLIYVGLPGDGSPKEEVAKKTSRKIKDLYFSVYSEPMIAVAKWDEDPASKRIGLPLIYTLTPNSNENGATNTVQDKRQSIDVHWSRVIHLAEGASTNPLVGIPYLKPVIDGLVDHRKAKGGAAEGSFQSSTPRFGVDVAKDANIDTTGWDEFQERAEKFVNEIQNFVGMAGASIKSLNTDAQSPKDAVSVIVQELLAYAGLRLRVLTGEGGGQYVGNEDRASMNQLVEDLQHQVGSPWMMRFHEIMQQAGIYSIPDDAVVGWPIPEATDELTKSEIGMNDASAAESKANAIATYTMTPGVDEVVPPEQFLEELVGMTVVGAKVPELPKIEDVNDDDE